ncbi:hypothetical protein [Methanoplanus endosymbiosus]|uniref:DNA methylase adenine-specific domain-containing protein n=1 Tax=Methanoplanus endosymbiosus TaxID=33865 RepID=A0A9E7PRY0_9EURY|nr:hypothetical protein [Methanoplanus endosymbiosus]UUX92527.1 hypothetical protein L6E24_14525 [Methanoplanus endosymbiosus]
MNSGIERERQLTIRQHLDNLRCEIDIKNFPKTVRYLRGNGFLPDISDLIYLQQLRPFRDGTFSISLSALQFILELIKKRSVTGILDPYGGYGIYDAWLAQNLPDNQMDIVTPYSGIHELIDPLKIPNLKIINENVPNGIEKLSGTYDAIISALPIGAKNEKRTYKFENNQIELTDDPSFLSIVELEPFLSANGFFALVVPHKFYINDRKNSVYQNLDKFGLHISALLRFQPGSIAGTGIGFKLVIIERKPYDKLFVAEVPEGYDTQVELINRLNERRQGKTPSQGRLVIPDQFYGLSALEAKERYGKLVRNKGLEPVLFSDAVPEILHPRSRSGNTSDVHFEENPNCLYLPIGGTKDATTSQDIFLEDKRLYLQLFVNPEIVLPDYLAGFLNTPAGQSLRQMCTKGSINKVRLQLLNQNKLHLPSIEEQRLVLEADNKINILKKDLSDIKSQLWDQPKESTKVFESLERLNHEDRFSDWIETLPFPLASILRLYLTSDSTNKDRYERLLHFFEALTQFYATIHISAFSSNSGIWEENREYILKTLSDQNLSVKRSSFGLWRIINEKLSANLRKMLKSDEIEIAFELYATSDIKTLEMLSSGELISILQKVNKHRNQWKGHGGAVTANDASERLRTLKDELGRFREITGKGFNRYQLIEPKSMTSPDGLTFLTYIRRVIGSNPQLEQDDIEISLPVATDQLYLYAPEYNKVRKLVPIIRLHDTLQPTSYFYNRLESSGSVFISYQFSTEPEIHYDNESLLSLIEDLSFKQWDS